MCHFADHYILIYFQDLSIKINNCVKVKKHLYFLDYMGNQASSKLSVICDSNPWFLYCNLNMFQLKDKGHDCDTRSERNACWAWSGNGSQIWVHSRTFQSTKITMELYKRCMLGISLLLHLTLIKIATIRKFFTIRLLEEMYNLGYSFTTYHVPRRAPG